jgi:hypothetical protein
MIEGWHHDEYLILFDEGERESIGDAYALAQYLPGFRLIGLRFWDDLIVQNDKGAYFTVPAVPMTPNYLNPLHRFDIPTSLKPDARFTGKVKWHVKPVIFGGDPTSDENVKWIDLGAHAQFVTFWNRTYRRILAEQGSGR